MLIMLIKGNKLCLFFLDWDMMFFLLNVVRFFLFKLFIDPANLSVKKWLINYSTL